MHKDLYFILPSINGGGAEKVTVNYMNQFKNEIGFNVYLVLFDIQSSQMDLIPDFVKVIDLDTKSAKYSLFSLLKKINCKSEDIIYTTHSRIALLVYFFRFVKNCKHVARMQNMPSLEKKYKNFSALKSFLYKTAFKSADVVIAQTEDMKKDAIESFNINSLNIHVLHNPLDKDNIDSLLNNSNSYEKIEELSIVMSGRLHKNKAYDVAIKAISKVVNLYPLIKLYILGYDEGEKKNLEDLVQTLNLSKNVSFCGYTSNPYLYYKDAKLFILSSKIEGFPNALLENYYLNTPVVATKCVPIIEKLIVDGVNGYTVDVNDIEDLSSKIKLAIEGLDRSNIKNPFYEGSFLPQSLNEWFK